MAKDDDKFDYADFRSGPSEYAKSTADDVPDYISAARQARNAEIAQAKAAPKET